MNFQTTSCCRICLKTELLRSIYIYSPSFLMRPIEMIEKLHIFKVMTDDNLPTLLCQSCLYRLLDAYNLQQLAEASERRLREYLGEGNRSGTVGGSNLNSFNQESSSFSSTAAMQDTTGEADVTSAIYANICDMFERNINSEARPVVTDEAMNDVEIDVSSLTRSEANDDTLNEVFAGKHINYGYDKMNVGNNVGEFTLKTNSINIEVQPQNEESKHCNNTVGLAKTSEQCAECGKMFKYSGYLETHKRIHTGEKPYTCQQCLRQFAQSSNLLLHQRVHTGERRFQCEICANFFTTSSNLKAHKATHLERRDHQCKQCERTFKTARELRRHLPIHRSIKEHICGRCHKSFSKRSYLNDHMASMHLGVRRYKCNECTKVFSSRSNLVSHIRTHTGEKPFQCQYCTWKFNQSSTLVRHMKKHTKSLNFNIQLKTKSNDTNINNSTLINILNSPELLHTNDNVIVDTPLTQQNNNFVMFNGISNINVMSCVSNSDINNVDGTLSHTASVHHDYDFTKNDVLDFSTSQQANLPVNG